MAKFNIVIDKRIKLKGGKYNLAIRMVNINDVMYINVSKVTESQYEKVFVKKATDDESIQFRDTCNGYISKCEKIFNELKPFSKELFRKRFWEKEEDKPHSLYLAELFDYYMTKKEGLKPRTLDSLRYTKNRFETFKTGLSVGDITVSFLRTFEKNELKEENSQSTIGHHMRNLRAIINYFTKTVKVIPKEYEYPFGKEKFSVSTYFPPTQVLSESEIKSIVDLNEFKTKEHRFARDVWVALYRFNGANFGDLLRLKWNQINGDYIYFTRKKTETTRKNNKKPIIVPLTEKLKESINLIGDKNSPFLLGLLNEGYDEKFFENKNRKIKRQINRNLRDIKDKLKLSLPLTLGSARDCYANTLVQNDVPIQKISQMLGHSNVIVTEHYLAGLNPKVTFCINKSIL